MATVLPLIRQLYCGDVPALVAFAVNVTGMPAQTLVVGVEMLMVGVTGLSTEMYIVFEIAEAAVLQSALLIKVQVTESPFTQLAQV